MNLTEHFVFFSFLLCCLVQISELKSQDVIKQLVAAFEILPPSTNVETLSKSVYNFFPPIIPYGMDT